MLLTAQARSATFKLGIPNGCYGYKTDTQKNPSRIKPGQFLTVKAGKRSDSRQLHAAAQSPGINETHHKKDFCDTPRVGLSWLKTRNIQNKPRSIAK